MDRIRLACYSLIASAFVLAGLLLASLDGHLTSTAEAEMVIARENFTVLTAQTRDGVESLFVLDNASGRLLVYTLNLGRGQLEVGANVNLSDIFAQGTAGSGSRRGR